MLNFVEANSPDIAVLSQPSGEFRLRIFGQIGDDILHFLTNWLWQASQLADYLTGDDNSPRGWHTGSRIRHEFAAISTRKFVVPGLQAIFRLRLSRLGDAADGPRDRQTSSIGTQGSAESSAAR